MKGAGEEPRWTEHRRSLDWLLLFGGGLLLGKLVQDVESFLDLGTQTLRRIEQAQELGIVHLQQHTSDLSGEVRLRPIVGCVRKISGKYVQEGTYGAMRM